VDRPLHYILDDAGEPTPCDPLTWAEWFVQHPDARRIAQDYDENDPTKSIYISTTFLGLDHQYGDGPPILWETMVFGGLLDGEMNRYSSRDAALKGHQEMCRRVMETLHR
jgi:hypothetical protein